MAAASVFELANLEVPSSLIMGCSRCPRRIDWRTDPDVETTDWRARRGKTAHRVRREGTALAVSYPIHWPASGVGNGMAGAVAGLRCRPIVVRRPVQERPLDLEPSQLSQAKKSGSEARQYLVDSISMSE